MFLKMHIYIYKVSYCNKSGMRDSRKFLRRHNHLEPITLIEKVLVGRCPGVICVGGQLSQEKIVRVQLSGGNFSKWELYGRQLPGAQMSQVGIFQRAIARGALVKGAIVQGELSCSIFYIFFKMSNFVFLDQFCPKSAFPVHNRTNEHHHRIQHYNSTSLL